MPCEPFLGGFVCIRGRRRKAPKCWVTHCRSSSTKLCDWPAAGGKTCDRPVCDEHADQVGPDKHYCVAHSIENAKAKLRTGN